MEYIESLKSSAWGVIVLGALGSIAALVIIKMLVYIASTVFPKTKEESAALREFYKRTLSTGNRSDSLFLLVLACTLLIFFLIIAASLSIQIFITMHILEKKYSFGLALKWSIQFIAFYFIYKAVWSINYLVKAACARHGIEFDTTGKGANKANSAGTRGRAAD